MTTLRGRISPIPRAPSPNTAATGPSGNSLSNPRPSTSSSRSFKKTEADFEAALLNPNQTIFLSGSPILEQSLPTIPSTPPRKSSHSRQESHDYIDAPLPVEKRSYEDDLKGLSAASPGSPIRASGMRSPGVIPPTPAGARGGAVVDKRLSQSTMRSQESGTSTMSPSRMSIGSAKKMGPSLGIDAELNEGHKTSRKASSSSKRRSIFRSPGTASSPDLATLVRKKKEASNSNATAPHPPPSSNVNGLRRDTVNHNTNTLQKAPPIQTQAQGSPSRQAPTTASQASLVSTAASTSYPSPLADDRNRSVPVSTTQSGGSSDGWDRFSDLKSLSSGEKMATISERTATAPAPTPSRSRESSKEESSKSLRHKAKGMFGRMFGGPSNHSIPTTSPSATPRYSTHNQQSQPPVPSVPANYARHALPVPQTLSPNPFETPTLSTGERFGTPPEQQGRNSVTPTGRRPSETSPDKPLPPVVSSPSQSPPPPPNGDTKSSLHIRQPASSAADESPPPPERPRRPSATSSPRPAGKSFSDDVAGIFDSIGTSEPAKELGLPPESLRSKDNLGTKGKFPPDLGRAPSIDAPRRDSRDSRLLAPVPVTQRTSSLPTGCPSDSSPRIPQRTTSSPQLSPRPSITEDTALLPSNSVPVSRSSSTSSRRKKTQTQTDPTEPTPNLDFSVLGDFGPKDISGDTTLRARRGSDLPPLSPASVRLVHSPPLREANGLNLNADALAKSSFINSGPWGRQSPSPSPRIQSTPHDPIETVHTPNTTSRGEEQDDEEKGRRLACEFLEDDFSSVPADKVAEFLGGPRPVNTFALKSYMTYFDMKDQTLVEAFRDLCAKLHLRAESQEIDRIIEAFSARYFECNPATVFGTPGVVHTVTGAMLMLNTDLHIADLAKHMSRADFVRNSMRAIQESMPSNDRSSTPDLVRNDSRLSSTLSFHQRAVPSAPLAHRSASAPVAHPQQPVRSESDRSVSASSLGGSTFNYSKAWESEAESALKDIFNQVRADKILLPISGVATPNSNRQSIISLGSDLGRNKTIRSPSGRSNDRVNALKRGSIRGMQSLMNNPYGSNFSSSDGRLSPTPSYATSINESSTFTPTIGFASNLSHTVIREHDDEAHSIDSRVSADTVDDEMDDDELALLGAPWAKEGMLWKRAGGEGMVKKKSGKEWKQYFVVVQKGELLLFTFGSGSGSVSFGAVGGGNWLNNANTAGRFSLVHATTTALPGGYSRDRPYVFTVHFPNAETIFLQAGTDDLVAEWINTCNYWSSRKSRPPLQGGVSNMEYGWNRVIEQGLNNIHHDDDRASVRSGRSNMSRLGGTYGRRPLSVTAADRMHINDWKPPQPTLVPSPLDEESQVEALQGYVRTVKDDLDSHQALESAMTSLFTPGSKNAIKAHANWSARLRYLETEVARHEQYVESLRTAISLRIKKQGERRLDRSLARSMTSLHRRESEDLAAKEVMAEYERSAHGNGNGHGLRERREVPQGLRIHAEGLAGGEAEDGDEEVAQTPLVRNGSVVQD